MIALQVSGLGREFQGQNLNLTAKEKRLEEDIQSYNIGLLTVLYKIILSRLLSGLSLECK